MDEWGMWMDGQWANDTWLAVHVQPPESFADLCSLWMCSYLVWWQVLLVPALNPLVLNLHLFSCQTVLWVAALIFNHPGILFDDLSPCLFWQKPKPTHNAAAPQINDSRLFRACLVALSPVAPRDDFHLTFSSLGLFFRSSVISLSDACIPSCCYIP